LVAGVFKVKDVANAIELLANEGFSRGPTILSMTTLSITGLKGDI